MAVRTPICLTIAGSDSGGGAGIQADLKAFAAQGVHGTSAITGLTAQNTVGVDRIDPVSPGMIVPEHRAVVEALGEVPAGVPVVVDPVMVAESGARLLQADAQQAYVRGILPLATVVTPNLPEALVLAGRDDVTDLDALGDDDVHDLARRIQAAGPENVLITGGHRAAAEDLLLLRDGTTLRLPGRRHPDGAAHGSGCTHSSTLAARLALGDELPRAARVARLVAGEAVRRGLRDVGAGPGPVDVLDLPSSRERAERAARDAAPEGIAAP
jgi:hydroxymethylpyrimidine/phosphomethylpyrimidine kinase